MKALRNILFFLPGAFLLALASCNPDAKYSTKPVYITLEVDSSVTSSATLKVNITPEKDVYYYCGIITEEAFNNHGYDFRFMQYITDSVYSEYLSWRKNLVARSMPYVASFSSHSLGYGKDSRVFTNLNSGTDYIIYAFCVNPEAVSPMGELFVTWAETAGVSMSTLTFTYSIEHKSDGVWLTIEPSNDDEPYINDIEGKEMLDYNEGPADYLHDLMQIYAEIGSTTDDGVLSRGFMTQKIDQYALPGKEYCVMAAGYDGGFTTPVYYVWFTYHDDMEDIIRWPLQTSEK